MNRRPGRGAHLLGPFFMCLAALGFAALDALIKFSATGGPLSEVIWVRYAVQTLIFAIIFVPRSGRRILRTENLRMQLVRGGFLLGASLLVINGLSRLPLTETTAVLFIAPIFVTLFSGPFLGEKARTIDWVAVLFGFCGVLIIVRPGGGLLTWAILFPIGTAICNAVYQMVTRSLRRTEHPVTTNLYSGMIGTLALTPLMPWVWEWPDPIHAAAMLMAGLVGAVSHFMMTKALAHSPASTLGPFGYTQLIWASLFGFLVFGALPDFLTWVGIGVIAAGGLLLSLHHVWVKRSDIH